MQYMKFQSWSNDELYLYLYLYFIFIYIIYMKSKCSGLRQKRAKRWCAIILTSSKVPQGITMESKPSKPVPMLCSFIVYRSKFPNIFSKIIPVQDHCHDWMSCLYGKRKTSQWSDDLHYTFSHFDLISGSRWRPWSKKGRNVQWEPSRIV